MSLGSRGNVVPATCYATAPPFLNAVNAQALGFTMRSYCKAPVAITDLQLWMANWFWTSTGEHANLNTVTVQCAIEFNGVTYPVTFGGQSQLTIDIWATIKSDYVVGLELAAGDVYYIRIWFNTTAAGNYNGTCTINGSFAYLLGQVGSFTAGANVVTATGACASLSNTVAIPNFLAVVGRPLSSPTPVILGVGDSITAGKGDVSSLPYTETLAQSVGGWFQRGVSNGYSAVSTATSALTAQTLAATGSHVRLGGLWSLGTHAAVMLGINDINAGRTAAQLEGDLTAIYTDLTNRGLKVYAATMSPRTTSTDSWATLVNQTVTATEAVRTAVNDWIRSIPAPLAGYVETADQVESSRNSGLWIVNGAANYPTTDGLHPAAPTHALMGAALNAYLAQYAALP